MVHDRSRLSHSHITSKGGLDNALASRDRDGNDLVVETNGNTMAEPAMHKEPSSVLHAQTSAHALHDVFRDLYADAGPQLDLKTTRSGEPSDAFLARIRSVCIDVLSEDLLLESNAIRSRCSVDIYG